MPDDMNLLLRLKRVEIIDQRDVTGSLEAISQCASIEVLELVRTGVGGELLSLRGMTQMTTLNLSGSYAVSGNVEDLSSMRKLRTCWL